MYMYGVHIYMYMNIYACEKNPQKTHVRNIHLVQSDSDFSVAFDVVNSF